MFKFNALLLLLLFDLVLGLNSEKNHAISKRALLFPRATVLQFTYGLSIPAILPSRSINLSYCLQVNYNLPFNITTNFRPMTIQAKSKNDFDLSREVFYKYIMDFLEGFGLDGEECMLRSICEIAESPMHLEQKENLLEKIIHFIFTPSLEMVKTNSTETLENKLLLAEELGGRKKDCAETYPVPSPGFTDQQHYTDNRANQLNPNNTNYDKSRTENK